MELVKRKQVASRSVSQNLNRLVFKRKSEAGDDFTTNEITRKWLECIGKKPIRRDRKFYNEDSSHNKFDFAESLSILRDGAIVERSGIEGSYQAQLLLDEQNEDELFSWDLPSSYVVGV